MHKILILCRLLQEKFHCSRQELQLDLKKRCSAYECNYHIIHTCAFSSLKFSTNMLIISSALSMRSAYSPMIHASEALASGSSNASKFSHSVDMMPSYLCGYLRKMSCQNLSTNHPNPIHPIWNHTLITTMAS